MASSLMLGLPAGGRPRQLVVFSSLHKVLVAASFAARQLSDGVSGNLDQGQKMGGASRQRPKVTTSLQAVARQKDSAVKEVLGGIFGIGGRSDIAMNFSPPAVHVNITLQTQHRLNEYVT
jgi:hypothetical protein